MCPRCDQLQLISLSNRESITVNIVLALGYRFNQPLSNFALSQISIHQYLATMIFLV